MFLNSVDQQLLLLIDSLSASSDIATHFYLAGGTGLASQHQHRSYKQQVATLPLLMLTLVIPMI